DRVQIVQRDPRLTQCAVHDVVDHLQVCTRRDLGNDAPVYAMRVLREDDVPEHVTLTAQHGGGRFVAGRFDAEDERYAHGLPLSRGSARMPAAPVIESGSGSTGTTTRTVMGDTMTPRSVVSTPSGKLSVAVQPLRSIGPSRSVSSAETRAAPPFTRTPVGSTRIGPLSW